MHSSQNGPGIPTTRVERFDIDGNLTWDKDARGFITHYQYDGFGKRTRTVQDVDTTIITSPTGWITPTGGGLHLISDSKYDRMNRLVDTLGPEHEAVVEGVAKNVRSASWTVHDIVNRETRSAQGYHIMATEQDVLVIPVSISKYNAQGTRSESIQAVRTSTAGILLDTDTFDQSTYVRWSVELSDAHGRRSASRVYHTIPTSGDGESSTHYDETTFAYDIIGRLNRTKSPGGTIQRTVFDSSGNPAKTYVGTDDTGATDTDPTGAGAGAVGNNMVLVIESLYEVSCGCGSDGKLVQSIQHVDATTKRTTAYDYDWRGRQEYVWPERDDQNRQTYSLNHYDNLGRNTRTEQYHETGTGDILLARQDTFHDAMGRTFQTKTYAVNPTTGAVGDALVSNTWYDAAGNPIKQQSAGSRAFTKTEYDSLGRATKIFTGYDLDESTYAHATTITGDTIVEQSETTYNDVGQTLFTTHRQRLHDATGTGELTTPSGNQPKARVIYSATWYDGAGRPIASAAYGTNGGNAFTRPTTIPTRSDDVLVSETFYNDAGEAFKTIDPAGRDDRQYFDAAGRSIKTIQNYVDGVVNAAASDEDVTVETTYTCDGQISTLTAHNPTTGNQTTRYIYGTTLADSDIARADLLRAEIYPDSDDIASPLGNGPDGVYDRIEFTYNRTGQQTSKKDQNGTIHEYLFDPLGRPTTDRVTLLGTGINGAVRRITRTYEIRGMLSTLTSHDAPTSGNIVNQVTYEYTNTGQLHKEYQSHSGAKTSNTPYVGHNYSDSTRGYRLTSTRYPNGRLVHTTYGTTNSTSDILSRIATICDDTSGQPGDTLAEYQYLGRSSIVGLQYPEPDIHYTPTLDRFGRITDLLWHNATTSTDLVHIRHGYDRANNRTYREDPVAASYSKNFDGLYTYDGMNRLVHDADAITPVAHYQYDARNHRTTKNTYTAGTLTQTRHFYHNHRWQCLEERLENSGVLSTDSNTHYLWCRRYIDALILRDRDTTNPSNGVFNSRHYFLQDPNFNVTAISDSNGTIQERYAYSAYGKPIIHDATFTLRATSTVAIPYLYTGRHLDGETELYYYRARYFDSSLGRFIINDPIGYIGGTNLYQYSLSNSLVGLDPLGTMPWMCSVRVLSGQKLVEYALSMIKDPTIVNILDKKLKEISIKKALIDISKPLAALHISDQFDNIYCDNKKNPRNTWPSTRKCNCCRLSGRPEVFFVGGCLCD